MGDSDAHDLSNLRSARMHRTGQIDASRRGPIHSFGRVGERAGADSTSVENALSYQRVLAEAGIL